MLGVVQAGAIWQRGAGQKRSNLLQASQDSAIGEKRNKSLDDASSANDNLTFVQKLEQKKAHLDQ